MSDPNATRDRIVRLGGDTSRGPIAICEFCDYMVQHEIHAPISAIESVEIARFLRQKLFDHLREVHPEKGPWPEQQP